MKQNTKQKGTLCSKMRIQTQILIFSFVTSTVVMTLLFAIVYVFFQKLTIILIEQQQNIFQLTTSKQLQQYMTLQKQIITIHLDDNQEKLLQIDKLFTAIEQEQIIAHNEAPDSSVNHLKIDSLAYHHSFCYLYCNKFTIPQNQQNTYNLITLAQVLTETISLYNIQSYYYVSGGSINGLFTIHQGSSRQEFNALRSPWITEHIQYMKHNNNATINSNSFVSTTFKDIYIAQTANLTYLNQSLAEMISNDISFSKFPLVLDGFVDTIIANSSGHIMFSKWYSQGLQTIITIANESITGFNETSWTQIKDQAQNPKPILLLYNTQLNQTVYVTVTQLDYPQYYLILYNSTIQQDYDQKEMMAQLDNFEFTLLSQFGLSVLTCFLFSILLVFLIISQTLKPINNIVGVINARVYDKYTAVKIETRTKSSSLISKLLKAYDKLIYGITNQGKINSIQVQVQQIEYPINNFEFECDNSQLLKNKLKTSINETQQLVKSKQQCTTRCSFKWQLYHK